MVNRSSGALHPRRPLGAAIRRITRSKYILRARAAAYRRKQEADFSEMLGAYGAVGAVHEARGDAQRRMRPLPERPHALVLGHLSWERHGLWPSLARLADVHMIEAGRTDGGWSEADRGQLTESVRVAVTDAEATRPFDLMFAYCDSCFIDPQLLQWLRLKNIWTVLMALDDQHKFLPRREHGMSVGQTLVAPLVDVYWTTWPVAASAVHRAGGRAFVAAPGADPEFHKPLPSPKDIDVLFLGARYGVRDKLVTHLRNHGVNLQAFGRGWENGFVSFEESVALISRARVVLGVGTVGHSERVYHLKGRDFEVPMCGAAYLTSYHPQLCDWFRIGEEILCYSSPQNCAELLLTVLGDDKRLASVRSAARARSLQDHTWETRFTRLFEMIRNIQDGSPGPSVA